MFINCFTELATWGSSSRFLPKGLSQPIQPQLLLHDLKAWRQGHFDLYSKQKTTCFNFLFTPWPQRQSLFLLSDGDDDDLFVFIIALTFLWNTNWHIYLLNTKSKLNFFRESNYLDKTEASEYGAYSSKLLLGFVTHLQLLAVTCMMLLSLWLIMFSLSNKCNSWWNF